MKGMGDMMKQAQKLQARMLRCRRSWLKKRWSPPSAAA